MGWPWRRARMFLTCVGAAGPIGRPKAGILWPVSQVDRDRATAVAEELPPQERALLEEQLTTYRELLAYLHDH